MKNLTAVESIFTSALAKATPEELGAYLNQACGPDAELRRHVERLLEADGRAEGFLNGSAPAATMDEPPAFERPGTSIGPYKLLQEIGAGGMGTVYMAEQQEPVRRMVALKVIKPGMDSTQVIARFEAERQALALMDHPNIAKVLDAGTTESDRPYFVMELVKGIPITRFCDENQLTPRQRLELFLPVCQAVQHAHQKGIIHRDLKPSNVLVALYDDRPVPKVIDFGVAKAISQKLTERTLFTAFGSFVGTLEYMSPEQAKLNALDIDTRSDVYALGVLLYELLTGNTPLEHERLKQTALDELLRTIREEEPPKPSTRLSRSGEALVTISAKRGTEPAKLGQVLRGELDWIVMKALEKDRTLRYETANGLARDLQHYLADGPVEACPPTASYKLRKFARKNQKVLATAAGFIVLLMLGVAGSAWQAVRATQAEAVALANEQQANANAVQAQEKEQEANQQRDEAQRQRDEVQALNNKLAAKEQQLQRTLYAAHMNLAKHAWDAGAFTRVSELLEQHRPQPGETDLRGFEWDYLYRLSHAELLTIKADARFYVYGVAYSPDGKRLATAIGWGDNATVKVWDAQTGQELLALKGGSNPNGNFRKCVAFSPDGKLLAGGDNAVVKVWDAQTGQEILSLQGAASSVAFSPDGKRLASAGRAFENNKIVGVAKIWDVLTGREILTLKGAHGSVTFSPDGKRLASGNKVWDAQTGQELLSLQGHTGAVYCLAYTPDGTRIATTSRIDKTVKVWDARTGQELLSVTGCDGHSVVFSPDGKRLASISLDQTLKLWDAQTGREFLSLKGHELVKDLAFSPDGTRLVSGGDTVRIWDAQQDPRPRTFKVHDFVWFPSAAFSPDGTRLASGGMDRSVKVWDAKTGQELLTCKGHTTDVHRVAYSPDGKRLVSASGVLGDPDKPGEVKVWDAQTGQELLSLSSKGFLGIGVAFSPDGSRIVTSGGENHPVSGPGGVKVWDAQSGQELLTVKHNAYVYGVAFSPDGKRLAGYTDQYQRDGSRVKVWDAETGRELLSLKGPGSWNVAFSRDGKRLASGSQVWDAETGRELVSLKGHRYRVESVAFSPDGKRLATASVDKTVKLWDAETGTELLTFPGRGMVAFSPDGHRLASGTEGGTVTIYDATPLPQKP
jgi:WD40 repeat protein/serine/threonine protein kinase